MSKTSPKQLAYCKKYNTKNREEINKKVRDRSKRYREEIFNILGNKCCICGFSDKRALQIDHVNGGGSKERKNGPGSNMHKVILDRVINGSIEYQILCANCNWIKRVTHNENRKII